jgi:ubiquitin-conjugating enzyme E2 W
MSFFSSSSTTTIEFNNKNPARDTRATRRIDKELEKFRIDAAGEGLDVTVKSPSNWDVRIQGAVGTLYEGEQFILEVHFTNEYPMESPIVFFKPPSPIHEHIYSNGHICLNILGSDWSPALTVKSVCLSILSMMSSATSKVRPDGDDRYSQRHPAGSNPKETRWLYEDDTV